jgi:acetolactate synthase-1/2/3 large subunit
MIIAGNGVLRGRASEALARFAEAYRIPVVNTFMGKGAVSYRHPLFLVTVGLQAEDPKYCGLADADLVVSVGYDLVEYAPRFWNPGKDKRIVHIDTQPAEVDAYYNVAVGLLGSIEGSLERLSARASPREGHLPKVRDPLHSPDASGTTRLFLSNSKSSPTFVFAGDDDVLISDVAHGCGLKNVPARSPMCVIERLAAMGIALRAQWQPSSTPQKEFWRPWERRFHDVPGTETAGGLGPFCCAIFNDGHYGVIPGNSWRFKRTATWFPTQICPYAVASSQRV